MSGLTSCQISEIIDIVDRCQEAAAAALTTMAEENIKVIVGWTPPIKVKLVAIVDSRTAFLSKSAVS